MKSHKNHHKKSKLIPYVLFPMIVGILSGVLIFLFKIASSHVMHKSEQIYAFVRQNPAYLPLLILGVAAIGVVSALILTYARECRGGGIPTAVASIRGLMPLKWIQGIFVLFGSALLTYLSGVPLGNEGPSVQMGTAVGKGSSRLTGANKQAWERYLMTSGACSGFAIATGAPLSGILFALEEAHRRFSTTLFTVASIAVLSGTITHRYLSFFFKVDTLKNSPTPKAIKASEISERKDIPETTESGTRSKAYGPIRMPAAIYAVTFGSRKRFVTRVRAKPKNSISATERITGATEDRAPTAS